MLASIIGTPVLPVAHLTNGSFLSVSELLVFHSYALDEADFGEISSSMPPRVKRCEPNFQPTK